MVYLHRVFEYCTTSSRVYQYAVVSRTSRSRRHTLRLLPCSDMSPERPPTKHGRRYGLA